MTDPFQLIFCKLYQWIKRNKGDDSPQWTALAIYSILLTFNFGSFYAYGYYFVLGYPPNIYKKLHILLLSVAIMIILYLVFIRKHQYKEMYERYKESVLNKNLTTILSIGYIVLSVALVISLIWLGRGAHRVHPL